MLQLGHGEQTCLGPRVAVHVAVVVQVVVGQVGEYGRIEMQAVDPALYQAVGGDLQYRGGDAGIAPGGQLCLQAECVRGGIGGLGDGVVENRSQGTNGAAVTQVAAQQLRQHPGGRGLAVGAGDTGHDHVP